MSSGTKTGAERRTSKVVDKQLQNKLVMRLGGLCLFYFLCCLTVVIAIPMGVAMLTGTQAETVAEISFRLRVLFQVLLAPLLVTFAALWIHGIKETSRIAGPHIPIKKALAQLRSMRIPQPFKVRDNDYLQDTVADFSTALIQLRDEFRGLQAKSAENREVIAALTEGRDDEVAQRALATAEQLQTMAHRFEVVSHREPVEPVAAPAEEATAPAGA